MSDHTIEEVPEPHIVHFCGCRDRSLGLVAELAGAWRRRHLKWKIEGSLPSAPLSVFRAAVKEACDYWQAVCGLTFAEAGPGERADIVITTGQIDGSGGTLAWSQLPQGDDRPLTQKYDTSERFVIAAAPKAGQIDLVAVVCHEFGHALGLDHDRPNSGSLMAPTYRPGLRKPQQEDVARMQRLYGPPSQPPAPEPGPTPGGSTITIEIINADYIRIPGYRVTKE